MALHRRSLWLITATVAIVVAPLVVPGLGGAFKGSDDLGTEAINEARPGYQPWFQPLWKPPSDEIESLLFALQAAAGAGFLGYMIGRRHASRQGDVANR
jgi:cobalt/nickel transport protein